MPPAMCQRLEGARTTTDQRVRSARWRGHAGRDVTLMRAHAPCFPFAPSARYCRSPMSALRVLLVEDHDEVRAVLAFALEHQGFDLRQAADGVEALDSLEATEWLPDVLVTDMEMPRLDGSQLVAELRRRPGLADLPVLVVTAIPGDARVQALRVDPLVAVVAKPRGPCPGAHY
jgi:CheY-like chemotaxis protein